MEYQNIYNILYDALYNIFPKAIIKHIIFEYVVESNKYIYRYTVSYHQHLRRCYVNKQLGIICCESGTSFRLLDYNTGKPHDGSRINVKSLCRFNSMWYFNDNILIMTYPTVMYKYVLINKYYAQTHVTIVDMPWSLSVNDNFVYRIDTFNTMNYTISIYDLTDLKLIKTCNYRTKPLAYNCLRPQITIYDTLIYIYDGYTYIYVHDIDLNQVSTHHIPCDYDNTRIHKNKLYHYDSDTIYVYDILRMILIHSFKTKCNDKYKLLVSDDTIVLHNEQHIVFYEIK
jgi:hypothetical protein